MRRVVCLFVLLQWGCHKKADSVEQIKDLFSRPEYIPSTDYWAEARRRRVLGAFLLSKKISYSEMQTGILTHIQGEKYRKVTLRLRGTGTGEKQTVTLVLIPPPSHALLPEFEKKQRACDVPLFTFLADMERRLHEAATIDLEMSETCLGLTARAPGE